MKTTSRPLDLVVAILACSLPVIAQVKKKTDATTILNKMFGVYSHLASYQDDGILVVTLDGPTGGTIEKMPFKTFFKRPGLFRFEWTDYGISKLGKTKMIWSNGKEAFSYWEPDNYEKAESLGIALPGATCISYRTVNPVSHLMFTIEFRGSRLKSLTKVSLRGENVFEGVPCY